MRPTFYKFYHYGTGEYLGCVWCEGGRWFSEDRDAAQLDHESEAYARLYLTVVARLASEAA